jgi:DNA-binding winged helix-turn-helix (wHTH) protein
VRYEFGDCVIDLDGYELTVRGGPVHVEPQVFDVLAYLLVHRNRVVPKAELLEQIWGDHFVSDSTLASRIMAVRRAIEDDGARQRVIRTFFGRGYRFVAPARELPARPAGATGTVDRTGSAIGATTPDAPPVAQEIRFCRARDGTRIARATCGHGPVLVKAANWMTHLGFDVESRVWRHWIADLAARYTLVRYDERGCGMSDWDVDRFDFDAWVDDLAVVVDSLGLERFPLLGVSQGAAVAVRFAARHPERVSRMVLYGS